jgi:tRNA-uridine 2-sulfurtransferase
MSVIAIGLSGGIDSTYAALTLKEQGHELIGLTGIMSDFATSKVGQQAVNDAGMVAEQLDIPFHVVDLRDSFKAHVIKYFCNEYKHGRTPSPCVVCNPTIKFGVLLEKAVELGTHKIATGHYVNLVKESDNLYHLYKGIDDKKDQSYFLCRLTQKHLSRAMFPLGNMQKRDVKQKLAESGLKYVKRDESQEICFVADDDYVSYLEKNMDTKDLAGDFLKAGETFISRHNGIHCYTVGQRKGLGVALGTPAYVTKIDSCTNNIYLGEREKALSKEAKVTNISWLAEKSPFESPFYCDVQIRYGHRPSRAKVELFGDNEAIIVFDKSQFAVAPGQSAAFYNERELLGGGWIS